MTKTNKQIKFEGLILGIIFVILIFIIYLFVTAGPRNFNSVSRTIPIYPNSREWNSKYKPGSFLGIGDEGTRATKYINFKSNDSEEKIFSFYKKQLPKTGWEIIPIYTLDGKIAEPSLTFHKNFHQKYYELHLDKSIDQSYYFMYFRELPVGMQF